MKKLVVFIVKLFPCREVRMIQKSIRSVLDFAPPLAREFLIRQCLNEANNSSAAKTSLTVNKKTAEEVALLIIQNECVRKLTSGNHHIYRGVLSSDGGVLFEVFKYVTILKSTRGYQSDVETLNDILFIESEIKKAG